MSMSTKHNRFYDSYHIIIDWNNTTYRCAHILVGRWWCDFVHLLDWFCFCFFFSFYLWYLTFSWMPASLFQWLHWIHPAAIVMKYWYSDVGTIDWRQSMQLFKPADENYDIKWFWPFRCTLKRFIWCDDEVRLKRGQFFITTNTDTNTLHECLFSTPLTSSSHLSQVNTFWTE